MAKDRLEQTRPCPRCSKPKGNGYCPKCHGPKGEEKQIAGNRPRVAVFRVRELTQRED